MFSSIFLPITLALIMFGVGMSIRFRDLKRMLRYPKAMFIGLLCQMLVFPALAFGLAWLAGEFLGMPTGVQAGLVLVAICPGGTTANLVTYLIRSNVALAIILTAANSLLVLVTIPVLLKLNIETFIPGEQVGADLPAGEIVAELLLLVILPSIIGVSLRHYRPTWYEVLDKYMRYLLPAMMGVAFLGVMFLDKGGAGVNWSSVPPLLGLGLVLNIAGIAMGHFLSGWMGLKKSNQLTIAIQVGLQNIGLALQIAENMLGDQTMAEVAVIYGSFTFFSTLGGAWLLKKST
jgi:BASS family bile acid:Na+ symporter